MTVKAAVQRRPARPDPDNVIRAAPLVVTMFIVAGGACDSAAMKGISGTGGSAGTGGGGGHAGETGSGGAGPGPAVDAGTTCHTELGALPQGTCPPLYGDDSWKDPVCRLNPFTLREWTCGSVRRRTVGFGTHAYTCFYEDTRNTLVGASISNDIPTFCDNTSFTQTFGDVPPAASCTAPVDLHVCTNDGGVADSPVADAGTEAAVADDGGVPDVAAQDAPPADASTACRGGQADAQSPVPAACPLSFPGTTCLRSAVVANFSAIVYEQQCAGYRRRNYGFGVFALQCYYDPTALTLVAAEYFEDTPRFCNGSYGITYGTIPPAGACVPDALVPTPCPPDAAVD